MRSLLTALAVALIPIAASAHAFLDHAEPRVGSVTAKAPARIRLWFTEGLEPVFCRVSVTGPPGFHGAGPVKVVPGDPRSLTVDLGAPVPQGKYVVRWRVLSADTHMTEGDFSFQVGP
jgi:methionine-rich copper-binding protein CopC